MWNSEQFLWFTYKYGKECLNKKHDHDQVNESELREQNKERMRQWQTTLKEPLEEIVGQASMDPTPIESNIGNFLASLLKYWLFYN